MEAASVNAGDFRLSAPGAAGAAVSLCAARDGTIVSLVRMVGEERAETIAVMPRGDALAALAVLQEWARSEGALLASELAIPSGGAPC